MDSPGLRRAPGAALAIILLVAATSCDGPTGGTNAFSVSLASPIDTAYTRDTITVQVALSGTVDVVELRRDGTLLVTLSSPYTYAWDTTAVPEGNYQLTAVARRGPESAESEARTVVVDRTAPTVRSRSPGPNEEHVWVGDPIAVGFSEPIDPSTLSSASVTLTEVGGAELATEVVADDDGDAVTVEPSTLPDVPVELELALDASIADRAGNALVPPAPWSWSLPVWQRMGDALNVDQNVAAEHPRISLHDGDPVVVWVETNPDTRPPADVYVKRWDGDAWTQLGPALNDDPERAGPMNGHPDVAVDADGRPVVAWPQPIEHLGFVERWDGTSWQKLGDAFNVDPEARTRHASVALAPDGRPWIAWQEGPFDEGALHVARWTGDAWQLVGGARDRTGEHVVGYPSLVFDAEGRAVVAWSQEADAGATIRGYVDRWTGSTWQRLGGAFGDNDNFPPYVRLAAADDGALYASFVDQRSVGSESVLVVRGWDEDGGGWLSSGQIASPEGGIVGYGTLTVGANDRPVAAWMEQYETGDGAEMRFHVEAWDGFAFRSVGVPLEAGFHPFLDVAVPPSGAPLVTGPVPRAGGGPYALRVWRHNVLP